MQCKEVRCVVLCFVGLGYNMFIILGGGDFFVIDIKYAPNLKSGLIEAGV
jgi:hypothetical protein